MKDEYIRKQDAIEEIRKAENHAFNSFYKGLVKAHKIVADLPPADVVPVIHSEWEYHMSFGVCRNCGYEYNWTGTDAKNYCPNCGAKMDGGDEHGR